MMAPGSLVGFFLVFVLATWSLSLLATSVLGLLSSRLQTWGPAAEKRAAALARLLPAVLGALVTLTIAVYSAFPELLGGSDHCNAHGHHLHLCLVHGGEWASEMWAVVATAAILALFVVRGVHLASTLLIGRRRVRIIEGSSRSLLHGQAPLFVAPSQKDFCFAVGYLRPRIFVSSSLWERLDAPQRDAIVAHELAHIENHDLWQSLLLSLSDIFGAPFLNTRSRLLWTRATEILCDRLAADRVGDGTTVAEALLSWARGPRLAAGMSFSPPADALEERVVAVLSEQSAGHGVALRIACFAGALLTGATALVILLVDPLHHALETVFGLGAL
jgi:Zn-dependent protease with chaperone function